VAFNADLPFTAINVLSHGIPYMALVWIVGGRLAEREAQPGRRWGISAQRFFSWAWLPAFLLLLWGLAYLEEGFWDGLIWREHLSVFRPFAGLPPVRQEAVLCWLVPLLALPQFTHYVLDGFIWRFRQKPEAHAWVLQPKN
jgi:hypothetical protein